MAKTSGVAESPCSHSISLGAFATHPPRTRAARASRSGRIILRLESHSHLLIIDLAAGSSACALCGVRNRSLQPRPRQARHSAPSSARVGGERTHTFVKRVTAQRGRNRRHLGAANPVPLAASRLRLPNGGLHPVPIERMLWRHGGLNHDDSNSATVRGRLMRTIDRGDFRNGSSRRARRARIPVSAVEEAGHFAFGPISDHRNTPRLLQPSSHVAGKSRIDFAPAQTTIIGAPRRQFDQIRRIRRTAHRDARRQYRPSRIPRKCPLTRQ